MLNKFEKLFTQLHHAETSMARAEIGKRMIALFTTNPSIAEVWLYRPSELMWIDRFIKKELAEKLQDTPIFHDETTNLLNAPRTCGLYFLGNTAYNPHTNEVFYWVKIGASSNLHVRMKAYSTSNPSAFVIGYKETNDYIAEEHNYHLLMEAVSLYRNQNNVEWFMVDRNTYLEMCEKGFNFFQNTLDK
jgi:hypothetical protein